jgi:hypothetical protein
MYLGQQVRWRIVAVDRTPAVKLTTGRAGFYNFSTKNESLKYITTTSAAREPDPTYNMALAKLRDLISRATDAIDRRLTGFELASGLD